MDGSRPCASEGSDLTVPVHSEALADLLATRHNSASPVASITWLNHWSAQQVLRDEEGTGSLSRISLVGIDGTALALLLGHRVPRTSADALIPELLPQLRGARVIVIGGTTAINRQAADELQALMRDDGRVVAAVDGYAELAALESSLRSWLHGNAPTVVIVGLGAAKQERVTTIAANAMSQGLVITCGGFLDQVTQRGYYPWWAYPLRLNWLVRLAREPKRLWRRYTVDAVKAWSARRRLRAEISSLAGFQTYLSAFEGDVLDLDEQLSTRSRQARDPQRVSTPV